MIMIKILTILIDNVFWVGFFWVLLSLMGFSISGGTLIIWYLVWITLDLIGLRWPKASGRYWGKKMWEKIAKK